MICSQCGKDNPQAANFCEGCGTKLIEQPAKPMYRSNTQSQEQYHPQGQSFSSSLERQSGDRMEDMMRSRTDRWIAGVCGGMGRHWNIDPMILRVAFIFVTMMGGMGFIAYIVLWIFMPLEPETTSYQQTYPMK